MRPDDPGISGDTPLLRALVDPGWWKLEAGVARVTSFAFTSGDEVSCYIDTQKRRITMAERYPNVPVGRFLALAARSLGFSLSSDPEHDPDGSPEHIVLTTALGRNQHHKACRSLARNTVFIPFEHFRG